MPATPIRASWPLLLVLLGAPGCRGERASTSAAGPPAPALSAAPAAGEASPAPPTAAECEGLWSAYHDIVPESPFVDHDTLVARCVRSERAVLGCVDRTKAEIVAMFTEKLAPDAGPPEPISPRFLTFAVGTRIGVCLTRERLQLAQRTGELTRLAREIASDGVPDGPHGTRVVAGSYATLPWRGMHELGRTAEPAPPGEIRVSRRPDGRVWIYFLGALLGRHQNQMGFLYAGAPFVPGDFKSEEGSEGGPARERVCLESDAGGPDPAKLYMLSCFHVVEHLSPQLLQVGAAPD